jgi:tRNA(Leu) C34 or U34 (ribose-2'-O)-methylase TrmL
VLYTIGGRYKSHSADTLNVPARIPLIELDDWNSFAMWAAPKAAVWVAIEMGGTPLSDFVHPRNAIYILGSEDHGVPKSVIRGCWRSCRWIASFTEATTWRSLGASSCTIG